MYRIASGCDLRQVPSPVGCRHASSPSHLGVHAPHKTLWKVVKNWNKFNRVNSLLRLLQTRWLSCFGMFGNLYNGCRRIEESGQNDGRLRVQNASSDQDPSSLVLTKVIEKPRINAAQAGNVLSKAMMSNLFHNSTHESHESISLYLTMTDDWRHSNQLTKGVASCVWSQLICQWHIDHHKSPSNFLWPECLRRASSMRKVLWPVRITKASVRST